MDAMLESFVNESRENIETAGRCFLELEKTPDNDELINDLFRAMHTMKGSSGLFDIIPFTKVVHAAEDVLDTVRSGELLLTPEHIDLFLDTMDKVSVWLDDLETTEQLGDGAEDSSRDFTVNLRALLGESDDGTNGNEPESTSIDDAIINKPPHWLNYMPDDVRSSLSERIDNEDLNVVTIEYTPDQECFFSGEDPLNLVQNLPDLVWFYIKEKSEWPDPEEQDPYQCNLVFYAVSTGNIKEIKHTLRYVSEQAIVTCLSTLSPNESYAEEEADISQPCIKKDSIPEAKLVAANMALNTQKQILSMPCTDALLPGRIASASTVLINLFQSIHQSTDELQLAIDMALDQVTVQPLVCFLEDKNFTQNDSVEKDRVRANDGAPKITLLPPPKENREEERRQEDRRSNKNEVNAVTDSNSQSKVLKVDQQRIDSLMDLVGELVVAKNALPFLAKRAENDFGSRVLSKEIISQYSVINRLSEELQSTMMQIRMVPIGTVFQRFPRLVRDLSRKLNKDIELVMEGDETEADKNVVENLADPLIHLVRNSLDHGLETSEERIAAGKDKQGKITLKAIPHDDQVVIEVIDDGRGIDPDIIKRKAYEKNVIDEQRLDNISDHDALQLILAPGFSTAEKISDLSGRGVGMDVVNSAVSQAGGSVMVSSQIGQGSTVRLSLPLSMAVSQVMMIEVEGQTYGVSMEDIVETVRIPVDSVQRIKHSEAVVLRDRLIPLFHLQTLLGLDTTRVESTQHAVLVMKIGGEEVGLIVDDFHEGIDIIQKPLEGVMENYPYYSGSALLGDGRVLLVLNVRELLACR